MHKYLIKYKINNFLMENKNIFKYIKTPCGQTKYLELQSNKSLLGKIRLFWFVIIASIKDWNIKS